MRTQRLLLILILLSVISFQLPVFLTGCAHVKRHSQTRRRLSAISTGNLEGMSKVEIIKKFGQPRATSKSEISECWYYARPREMWIWFEEDVVDHREVN